jgi:hypothetical protein
MPFSDQESLFKEINLSAIAVNPYFLATLDLARADKVIKDTRDAVFPRNYRCMAQAAPHINDHSLPPEQEP